MCYTGQLLIVVVVSSFVSSVFVSKCDGQNNFLIIDFGWMVTVGPSGILHKWF